MLVSHRYRFIYTKTVKTASTSVEVYFEPYCMREGEWVFRHYRPEYESEAGIVGFRGKDRPNGCRWWNHMPASQIRAQVGPELWKGYLKFCVIRNPYDKAVSAFYHFRRELGWDVPAVGSIATQFERWLERYGPRIVDRSAYVIDGTVCCDMLIRYESLQSGLEAVCRRLGIPWRPDRLPRLKSGYREDRKIEELYTPRAKALVYQLFRPEIEWFGYSFPSPRTLE